VAFDFEVFVFEEFEFCIKELVLISEEYFSDQGLFLVFKE
jgi:hypothetical protein